MSGHKVLAPRCRLQQRSNLERSYLDSFPGRVSVSQQFVSCGLDTVHLLLPELQLSHQTLLHKNNNQNHITVTRALRVKNTTTYQKTTVILPSSFLS